MNTIGLDLSLTSTGAAAVHGGVVDVRRFTSKGSAGATLSERNRRLARICDDVMDHVGVHAPDLVVVEGPAQHMTTGHQHDRAGLWWLIVNDLHRLSIATVEIGPSQLKKYATGKGNAGKDAVLLAVSRRYPHVKITGNDEADALVLAAMGARHLGQPLEADLPKVNLDAMAKVAWPTVRSR